MSKELKPCPFCGSTATMRGGGDRASWIICDNKKCSATQGLEFTGENAVQMWNTRHAEDALKYDLAQKKAALLIISQWCDRGLKDGMRKHDMNEVFLWIRKLAKEEMGKDYDTDR